MINSGAVIMSRNYNTPDAAPELERPFRDTHTAALTPPMANPHNETKANTEPSRARGRGNDTEARGPGAGHILPFGRSRVASGSVRTGHFRAPRRSRGLPAALQPKARRSLGLWPEPRTTACALELAPAQPTMITDAVPGLYIRSKHGPLPDFSCRH